MDNIKNKINYYLNNPLECEKIAKSGYTEAINNHTYQHRAQEFINHFSKYIKPTIHQPFNMNKMKLYSQIEKMSNKIRQYVK